MRTCTQNHVPKDQGSILLVVVLVAAAVLILASVAAPIFLRGENQRHAIETRSRLQSAFKLMFPEGQAQTKAKANMWTDFGYTPLTPPSGFYDLRALVERSAVATSDAAHGTVPQFTGTFPAWNGPYWQGSVDSQNRPLDAWGRPMRLRQVNGGWQVLSLGANGTDNTGASVTPVGDDLVYPELPYTLPVPPPVVVPPSIFYTLTNGYIGRANIDGTSPNHTFLNTGTTGLGAIAANDNHIYWVETTNQCIRRADRSGGNITTVVTLNHSDCQGLAVDSNYLYWTYSSAAGGQNPAIGRSNLDGSSPNHSWITKNDAFFRPRGVAVNSSLVIMTTYYNSSNNNTYTANLNGTSLTAKSEGWGCSGITANNTYHYWHSNQYSSIARGPASYVTKHCLTGSIYGSGVALDATYLYWCYSSQGPLQIGRAHINGLGGSQYFPLPVASAGGIAVK